MVGSNFPKKVGIDMKLLMTKKNYQIFYCKEKDNYVVYNMRKEWKTKDGIYGHTHVPRMEMIKNVTIINPGSISYPRQRGRIPTYMILEVDKDENFTYTLHHYVDKY